VPRNLPVGIGRLSVLSAALRVHQQRPLLAKDGTVRYGLAGVRSGKETGAKALVPIWLSAQCVGRQAFLLGTVFRRNMSIARIGTEYRLPAWAV
jgi:hypothetical protein